MEFHLVDVFKYYAIHQSDGISLFPALLSMDILFTGLSSKTYSSWSCCFWLHTAIIAGVQHFI